MCGIVAMFSEGGEVRHADLERATRTLRHRGPDAERLWVDRNRGVGLGHARLSILDLAGGHQPIENEDGSIRAVVNGELYDFERIADELRARGHRFRTCSDSEILVHLYEEQGAACVDELRGEFAFVLYDARNDLLIGGRDRFGIKPLFYGRAAGVLMLASEAKALFAAGLVPRWDHESFSQSMVLGGPADDRTQFADVYQLPPGHLLLASRRQTRLVRYWDFDYPQVGTAPARAEADEARELLETLDEAVRLRMRADVPVACYLSGGLDSCTVLGLAARHASTPIRAFTLAFNGEQYNEEPIAQEMARRAGAEYTPITVDETDFARDLVDAVYHCERTLVNANGIAKFRLSRAVRDNGIKVVLTGEGSDEIFAGYPHYRRDLFRAEAAQNPERAEHLLADLERTNAVSRGVLLPDGEIPPLAMLRGALGGHAPSWLEAIGTFGQKLAPLLSLEFAARQHPIAPVIGAIEVGRQLRGRHVVHQSMYLWSKTMLPNFILSVLGDRMEMAHSVEGRLPFLDHHVVELVRALPIDRLIRGTVEKYILREVARPFITNTVYRRQKHPFMAPPTSSSPSAPLHTLLQDTLRGPALQAVPFFERRKVVDLLDTLPRLDDGAFVALDPALMFILSTCILQERFAIRDGV